MRPAIVLGTRPEIIKMSPVIRALQREGRDFLLVHTGQHYSHEMDRVFLEQLGLPEPDHHLDVGSGTHGAQTARILEGVERVLMDERPDAVLVQGDTNSVVAGALAASKLAIPVGHVEAGLRSGDRHMPEEQNRVIADHLADLLYAPTEASARVLRREGLPDERVHVTGNTVVDAVQENREIAARDSSVRRELGLHPDGYVLLTAHRQENVDDPARFRGILEGARRVGADLEVPVVYPIHPRSRKRLEDHGLDAAGVHLVDPVDYLASLDLQRNACLVLTDSGGIQEEACVLGVPCVTLRDNTERPETVEVGANVLAGADAERIRAAAEGMVHASRGWSNPFGDGRAGERIVKSLEQVAVQG